MSRKMYWDSSLFIRSDKTVGQETNSELAEEVLKGLEHETTMEMILKKISFCKPTPTR